MGWFLGSAWEPTREALPPLGTRAYGEARELAAAETGMAIADFPAESCIPPEAVLRSGYLPED